MALLSPERRASLTAKAQQYADNLDEAVPYLLSRSITKEAAQMFNLGCVPQGHEHAGRLSIPYNTPSGVVTIKLRCTNLNHGDHKGIGCPKYVPIEAGLSLHLYNAQSLIQADGAVVITEGELDAIAVQAYCGIPAVAYPGVSTWKQQEHYPLCFEGISEVLVISDGDDVGREAAERVARSIGIAARVVELPQGLDSNSYLAQHGVAQFTERLFQ